MYIDIHLSLYIYIYTILCVCVFVFVSEMNLHMDIFSFQTQLGPQKHWKNISNIIQHLCCRYIILITFYTCMNICGQILAERQPTP